MAGSIPYTDIVNFIAILNEKVCLFKIIILNGHKILTTNTTTRIRRMKAREVRKRAKIRNRYNRAPHLIQDTTSKQGLVNINVCTQFLLYSVHLRY